jgi:hypothetical protein
MREKKSHEHTTLARRIHAALYIVIFAFNVCILYPLVIHIHTMIAYIGRPNCSSSDKLLHIIVWKAYVVHSDCHLHVDSLSSPTHDASHILPCRVHTLRWPLADPQPIRIVRRA